MSDKEIAVDRSALVKKAENFVLEMVIDGAVYKSQVGGLNKESVIALMTIATSVNMPRISGWNLYTEAGDCVASVNAMDFIAKMADSTPIGKKAGDMKAAGWSALPVVTPTSEEFQKMVEAAKSEGRIPSGRKQV